MKNGRNVPVTNNNKVVPPKKEIQSK